jgi:nitrate reductase gamma subunit
VTEPMSLDVLLFAVFPYVAIAVLVAGTIERALLHRASLTSRSTQFLENRQHFWAMVPFHYGLLVVLAGHLVAFLMPRAILGWNSSLTRLYALEVAGLACGLLAAAGLATALVRRATVASIRTTTAMFDWIVLGVLFAQIVSGVYVAIAYSWGSSWFAGVAAPYLWSIARLRPDAAAIVAMPPGVKAHVLCAWLLAAVFPFSRLVHVMSVPVAYLWRPAQIVRWYRPRPVSVEK